MWKILVDSGPARPPPGGAAPVPGLILLSVPPPGSASPSCVSPGEARSHCISPGRCHAFWGAQASGRSGRGQRSVHWLEWGGSVGRVQANPNPSPSGPREASCSFSLAPCPDHQIATVPLCRENQGAPQVLGQENPGASLTSFSLLLLTGHSLKAAAGRGQHLHGPTPNKPPDGKGAQKDPAKQGPPQPQTPQPSPRPLTCYPLPPTSTSLPKGGQNTAGTPTPLTAPRSKVKGSGAGPGWMRARPQEGSGGGRLWGRSAVSHGGAREKDRYQGARWARREQKLSGKRRINSRHAAASQAYAPQAGITSTQLGGERRGEWRGPAARGR